MKRNDEVRVSLPNSETIQVLVIPERELQTLKAAQNFMELARAVMQRAVSIPRHAAVTDEDGPSARTVSDMTAPRSSRSQSLS